MPRRAPDNSRDLFNAVTQSRSGRYRIRDLQLASPGYLVCLHFFHVFHVFPLQSMPSYAILAAGYIIENMADMLR